MKNYIVPNIFKLDLYCIFNTVMNLFLNVDVKVNSDEIYGALIHLVNKVVIETDPMKQFSIDECIKYMRPLKYKLNKASK